MKHHEGALASVKDYYNRSTRWYRWFYYDSDSLAMHYGFWDSPETVRKDALINQYRKIQTLLAPKEGEKVLDAGCGVGGASLWLAEHTHADYTGITVSERQIELANAYARRRHLRGRSSFELRNYLNTGFPEGSFDKAFAIESFCYAYPDPAAFLKEMHRILKPGGLLAIADGVLLREPANDHERGLADDFVKGFKMAGWMTAEGIRDALAKAGFADIHYIDKTKEIARSVADVWKRGRLVSPFRIFRHLGLVTKTEEEQLLATESQREMYDLGLFGYGIFSARKP